MWCCCRCDDGESPDRARLLPPAADSPRSTVMERPLILRKDGGVRKRALLVGIDYHGTSGELQGCCNDVWKMNSFLISHGWSGADGSMLCLTDDGRSEKNRMPTKANMIAAMQWLTAGAVPGDLLFFHFSGHGGQQVDSHGDEEDGYDETICPLDFTSSGQISDDVLFDILVRPLPAGVRLTVVLDCCHSGHGMDVPLPEHQSPRTLALDSATAAHYSHFFSAAVRSSLTRCTRTARASSRGMRTHTCATRTRTSCSSPGARMTSALPTPRAGLASPRVR